jgi:uncharacterized protein YcbX
VIRVTTLWVTPVKGTRIQHVERIELRRRGAVGNRHFLVVDDRNRMVNGKQHGELQSVCASWEPATRRLALAFPDGTRVEDVVAQGPAETIRFFSRTREVHAVDGPFAAALTEHVGVPLRLVEDQGGVDRGMLGAASLVARASVDRLGSEGQDEGASGDIDARRFRMLIEIDGVEAHAEDAWVGRTVRAGGAAVRLEGHVGRCLITGRDPDSGVSDLPTLDWLAQYRLGVDTTEPLAMGVYGRVVREGVVRVGDPVELER